MDYCLEALSLDLLSGVTVFEREVGAEKTLNYQLTLELALLAKCIRNSRDG